MRRNTAKNTEGPGQDSFLDIVANLVGILIILIMVIGAQATDAMVEAEPRDETAEDEPLVDVQAAQRAVASVEEDIHALDDKWKREQLEIAYRRKERDKFLQLATALQDALQNERQHLDAGQQQRLLDERKLMAARAELQDLAANRNSLEQAMPQQQVIEHLPTPMATTVFGKELHFRLLHGRLTFVPWDALIEMLKNEAPNHVWKLKDAPQITESLGPIGGFRMKYSLKRNEHVAHVGGMVARQRRIELDRFVLLPVSDDMGQPLTDALRDGSNFLERLSGHDPNRTTVTVWVYPDSFNEFRALKAELFRRGYLAAGRPMPAGHPIGGSPDGSRSAAQ